MKSKYLKENSNILTIDLLVLLVLVYLFTFQGNSFLHILFLFTFAFFMLDKTTCTYMFSDIKFGSLFIFLIVLFAHSFPLSGAYHTIAVILSVFTCFFGIVIYNHFKHPSKKKQFVAIYKFMWCYLMFMCLYCIIVYSIFPSIARPASIVHNQYIGKIAIPGYGFACAMAILSIFLLGLLVNGFFDYSKKIKKYMIVAVILMSLVVYKTESTTTFIIFLIGCFCCFYFKSGNKQWFYFKLVLFPFIILALIFVVPYIGNWLINISQDKMVDSRMYKRFFSLGNYFLYGSESVDAEYSINRFQLPFESLKTFFKNPIFGVAYQHGCRLYHPRDFGVGDHSEFLDALANYGVVGGIPFLSIFYFQIKEIVLTGVSRGSYVWVFVLVLLGIFNPLLYFYVTLVFSFFIPAFCHINKERLSIIENERDERQ